MKRKEKYELTKNDQPSQLLEAWLRQDVDAFKQALYDGCDPNYIYHDLDFLPILGIIARENVPCAKEFADIILTTNVDRNQKFLNGSCAIHIAAEVGNLGVLKALVEAQADINAVDQLNATALHILVRQKWGDCDQKFRNCVEYIMAQKHTDLNHLNSSLFSPIHWAAHFENREAVATLLSKKSSLDLDSNSARDHRTPREAILELDISFEKVLPPKSSKASFEAISNSLFALLYKNELGRFTAEFKKQMKDKSNIRLLKCDNGSKTYLQYACLFNMPEIVKLLISYGADVNHAIYNILPPVHCTGLSGSHEILKMLLDKNVCLDPDSQGRTALHYVAKYYHCNSRPHAECLKLLLSKVKDNCLDINAQDTKGDTALHFAVLWTDDYVVMELLKSGAYIGVKNMMNETPLKRISYTILKTFLDSNIRDDKFQHIAGDSESYIYFDYKFLMPPDSRAHDQEEVLQLIKTNESGESCATVKETEPLLIMSQNKNLQKLLLHPVIMSFILLKWQRIQAFYFANLLFYVIYCLLLTGYIIFGYRNHYLETNAFNETMENGTIQANANFTMSVESVAEVNDKIIAVRIMILCFTAILSLRELLQFFLNPKGYITNIETWLVIGLIGISTTLVVEDCARALPGELGYICPQLCAVAVLISWIELVLLIGKHPKYCVQVEMFRRVAVSFAKFLSWYIILVIAFALSFFVLFRDCPGSCKKNSSFHSPGASIFKTLVMLTGEFDAAQMPLKTYIGTSHIIFTAFIFLIAIVLVNLLSGLAVADTQVIRNKSYLYTSMARVKLIIFAEEVLLGSIASSLRKHFAKLNFFKCPFKCDLFTKNIKFFPSLMPKGNIRISTKYNGRIDYIGKKTTTDNLYFTDRETIAKAQDILSQSKVKISLNRKIGLLHVRRSLSNGIID